VVILPSLSTVATDGLLLLKATDLLVAFVGKTFQVNLSVVPTTNPKVE